MSGDQRDGKQDTAGGGERVTGVGNCSPLIALVPTNVKLDTALGPDSSSKAD